MKTTTERSPNERRDGRDDRACVTRPACPVCNAPLIEVRAKLMCSRCHTICETCCEGGRG